MAQERLQAGHDDESFGRVYLLRHALVTAVTTVLTSVMGRHVVPTLPGRIVNSLGLTNMTGAAVVLGPTGAVDMLSVDTNASIEIQITGTPTGTLTLEGSNQYEPITNASATFVPLAAGAINPALPAVAGAAVSYIGNLTAQALACKWVRLRYVNSASTGQLNAWFHGRGAS